MLLAVEQQVRNGQSLTSQDVKHHFGLARRHDLVLAALEQDQRRGQIIDVMDGRPLEVQVLPFRIGPDERAQVAGLELVSVLGKALKLRQTIVAGADIEDGASKCEACQGRVAPRTSAADCKPVAIDESLLGQEAGGIAAVINVDDAPLTVQAPAVLPAISRRTAVVHINDGKSPAGPILDAVAQLGPRR